MVEMVTSDFKLWIPCSLYKLIQTVFFVRYEKRLKKYLTYTVQYKTAQSDGSTPTDKIKPCFSLNKNIGQTTEAVKKPVIQTKVAGWTINYNNYRKTAIKIGNDRTLLNTLVCRSYISSLSAAYKLHSLTFRNRASYI
jgi:hypothetical protein